MVAAYRQRGRGGRSSEHEQVIHGGFPAVTEAAEP